MSALIIIALVWIALGLLLVLNIESLIRRAISWGAWEHEPFLPQPGRAGRSAPAGGARGATRPTIINDLARTGALQCPRPKLETFNPET
jgi:hypothetical protein